MKNRTIEYFIKKKNIKYLKQYGVSSEPMTQGRFLSILKEHNNRVYDKPIETDCEYPEFNDEVYSLSDWLYMVQNNMMCNDFGSGYWAKEGKYCDDEVFSSPQLDATHVVWFNK